ncbi:MAG: SMI1/KNR4 family protein [Capnocytophaga sp.]|nr:SMI1/KNR4 family protein [Capnocytophaga sp.]
MKKRVFNKAFFWQKPVYLPFVHSPLSDEMVAEFEHKIGYSLPKSMVELLKIQNGGYLHYGLPQTPPMQLWGIGEHYPNLILLSEEFDQDEDYIEFSLDDLLAFDGDGHYYFCLDYRQNKDNPKVSYIDLEMGEEESENSVVADSFDEFLAMLTLKTDTTWVIKSEKPLSEIVELFKSKLEIQFDAPNTMDFGYDKYRAKYGGHWLWLSPNTVPFAFARKGEHNYNQLKHHTDKIALLYPEISEKYTLLESFTPKQIQKLITELSGVLEIVPLGELV